MPIIIDKSKKWTSRLMKKRYASLAMFIIGILIAAYRIITIIYRTKQITWEAFELKEIKVKKLNNTNNSNVNQSQDIYVKVHVIFKDQESPVNISIGDIEIDIAGFNEKFKLKLEDNSINLKKKNEIEFSLKLKIVDLEKNILDSIDKNPSIRLKFFVTARFCYLTLCFHKILKYEPFSTDESSENQYKPFDSVQNSKGRDPSGSDKSLNGYLEKIINIIKYVDYKYMNDKTLKIGLKNPLFKDFIPLKKTHIIVDIGIINLKLNGILDGCVLINSFDSNFYNKYSENLNSTSTVRIGENDIITEDNKINEDLKRFIPGTSFTKEDIVFYFLTIKIDDSLVRFLEKLYKPNSIINDNINTRLYSLSDNQISKDKTLLDLFHGILNDDESIISNANCKEINSDAKSLFERASKTFDKLPAKKSDDNTSSRFILLRNVIIDNNELKFNLAIKESDEICKTIYTILIEYISLINMVLVLNYGEDQLAECTIKMVNRDLEKNRYCDVLDFKIRFEEEIKLRISSSKHFQLFINLFSIGSMNINLNNDLWIEMVDNKLNLVYKNSSMKLFETKNEPESLPFSVDIEHLLSDYKSSDKYFDNSIDNILGQIAAIDSKIEFQSITPIQNNALSEKKILDRLISNVLGTDKDQNNLNNILKSFQTMYNMIDQSINIILNTPNITVLARSKYVQLRSLINESTMFYNVNKKLLLGTMKIDSLCYYRCIPEKMEKLSLEGFGIDEFDIIIEKLFKLNIIMSDKNETSYTDEANTGKKNNNIHILPFNIKTYVDNKDNEIKIVNNVNNTKSVNNQNVRYPNYFINLVDNPKWGIIKNTIRAKNISYVHDFNINIPILLRIEKFELVHVICGNDNFIYLDKPLVLTTKFIKMNKEMNYELQYRHILNNSHLHFFMEAVINFISNIPKNNVVEPVSNIVDKIYLTCETNFGMDQSSMNFELRLPLDMFKFEEYIKFDTSVEEIRFEIEKNYNFNASFKMWINNAKEIIFKAYMCSNQLVEPENRYAKLYINRKILDRYYINIKNISEFILKRVLIFLNSKYTKHLDLFKKFSKKHDINNVNPSHWDCTIDYKPSMTNKKAYEYIENLKFVMFNPIDIKNTVFEDINTKDEIKIKKPAIIDLDTKKIEDINGNINIVINMWSDYVHNCIKETCASIISALPTRNSNYKLNMNIKISNEICIKGLPGFDLIPRSFYTKKPLTIKFLKGFRSSESKYINEEEYINNSRNANIMFDQFVVFCFDVIIREDKDWLESKFNYLEYFPSFMKPRINSIVEAFGKIKAMSHKYEVIKGKMNFPSNYDYDNNNSMIYFSKDSSSLYQNFYFCLGIPVLFNFIGKPIFFTGVIERFWLEFRLVMIFSGCKQGSFIDAYYGYYPHFHITFAGKKNLPENIKNSPENGLNNKKNENFKLIIHHGTSHVAILIELGILRYICGRICDFVLMNGSSLLKNLKRT